MIKRKEIAPGLTRYWQKPKMATGVPSSLYVLGSGESWFALDPASRELTTYVIEEKHYPAETLRGFVFSHYHNDHVDGALGLPEAPVWGSPAYRASLEAAYRPDLHARLAPSATLSFDTPVDLGGWALRFLPGRGHTVCGLLIDIGERYLHLNDLACFDGEGNPLLPLVFDSPAEYLATLDRALAMDRVYLVSHMDELDQGRIRELLALNRAYLAGIVAEGASFDLEGFQARNGVRFSYAAAHAANLKRLGC